jgi:hypothetical protein
MKVYSIVWYISSNSNLYKYLQARTKEKGAKTSIRQDITDHVKLLETLDALEMLLAAVESQLIPRVKAALDNTDALGITGELVDRARTMIGHVDGTSMAGAFASWQTGGRRGGPTWLNNPQFKITCNSQVREIVKLNVP